MLSVQTLSAAIGEKTVFSGISLRVRPRELHVLMGPNGSGKSSLAQVIAGSPKFAVTGGSLRFNRFDLLRRSPDERAKLGIFVAFQQPLAILGVPIAQFFRTALEERNNEALRPSQIREKLALAFPQAGLPVGLVDRELNVGFSGGEQKRFELAQLLVLGAKVAVLDEIDSGLDVDGIRRIAAGVEAQRNGGTGVLFITHNPHILPYLAPTAVHVLMGGRVVASGGSEFGERILRSGYGIF